MTVFFTNYNRFSNELLHIYEFKVCNTFAIVPPIFLRKEDKKRPSAIIYV